MIKQMLVIIDFNPFDFERPLLMFAPKRLLTALALTLIGSTAQAADEVVV